MVKKSHYNGRTKHTVIKFQSKTVQLKYCCNGNIIADVLNKEIEKLRALPGMHELEQ